MKSKLIAKIVIALCFSLISVLFFSACKDKTIYAQNSDFESYPDYWNDFNKGDIYVPQDSSDTPGETPNFNEDDNDNSNNDSNSNDSSNVDTDGDGIVDDKDNDIDDDGIENKDDNDVDGDGEENDKDTDDDNDGIPDVKDPTPQGPVIKESPFVPSKK